MKDVMIDLETFGNGKNACVVQVGAVYFNRVTGETGDVFKRNIDARSAVASGAEMDADTVYWWMSQEKAAIDSIMQGPLDPLGETFAALNIFLSKADAIWSHATFDFVIVMETFKRLGMKPKFSYRAARDIRTLIDLAQVDPRNPRYIREGTHHDALDDAKFQVKYCVHALTKLADGQQAWEKLKAQHREVQL